MYVSEGYFERYHSSVLVCQKPEHVLYLVLCLFLWDDTTVDFEPDVGV